MVSWVGNQLSPWACSLREFVEQDQLQQGRDGLTKNTFIPGPHKALWVFHRDSCDKVVGSSSYPALLPDHSAHYSSTTLFYLCLKRTPGSFQPRGLGPCHPMALKTLVSKLLVAGSVPSQRAHRRGHLLREAFPGHCISSTVTSFTVLFIIFPEKVPFSHLFMLFNVSFSNWSVSFTKQDQFAPFVHQ